MKFLHFPFVRLFMALVAGLLGYLLYPSNPMGPWSLWGLGAGISLLAYSLLTPTGLRQTQQLWGLIGLILLVFFGYALSHAQYQVQHPQGHWLRQSSQKGPFTAYTARVVEVGRTSSGRPKAIAELLRSRWRSYWQPSQGKALLYLPPSCSSLQYGDTLMLKGMPQPIAPAANPGAFDYREYLRKKGVYGQQFVKKWEVAVLGKSSQQGLAFWAWHWQQRGAARLRDLLGDPSIYGIAQALILGEKSHIDPEIRQAYSGAGAMHVLAVSGLHVGVVVGLLAWLLGRWQRREGHKWWVLALQLSLLWGYALITGGSPSVLRASTMFSVLLIGQAFQRNNHAGQSMAIAAFLLLLFDVSLLQEVGFQLSYAAVMGIVFMQPPIYQALLRLIPSKNRVTDYILQMAAVSLSAQAATLPISLYYFHQFPTYFLLANYWVVPLAGLVLPLGLAAVLLGGVPYVGEALGWLLYQGIALMNAGISFLEDLPYPHIPQIPFDEVYLLLGYGLLACIALFWSSKRLKHAVMVCLCCLCIFGYRAWQCYGLEHTASLAVYSSKKTAFGIVDGGRALLLHDSLSAQDIGWTVNGHWLDLGLGQGLVSPFGNWARNAPPYREFGGYGVLVWRGCVLVRVYGDSCSTPLPKASAYCLEAEVDPRLVCGGGKNTLLIHPSLPWNARQGWLHGGFPQNIGIHDLRKRAWVLERPARRNALQARVWR